MASKDLLKIFRVKRPEDVLMVLEDLGVVDSEFAESAVPEMSAGSIIFQVEDGTDVVWVFSEESFLDEVSDNFINKIKYVLNNDFNATIEDIFDPINLDGVFDGDWVTAAYKYLKVNQDKVEKFVKIDDELNFKKLGEDIVAYAFYYLPLYRVFFDIDQLLYDIYFWALDNNQIDMLFDALILRNGNAEDFPSGMDNLELITLDSGHGLNGIAHVLKFN